MMCVTLKNGLTINLRLLQQSDYKSLYIFLAHLSEETKKRFAPHPFDLVSLQAICAQVNQDDTARYIALTQDEQIVAYMLVKMGCLPKDAHRLHNYGLQIDEQTDCTFAPCVADGLQGSGLSSRMFECITADLIPANKKRIILWGGVQATNEKAVCYYEKLGFTRAGTFERQGLNFDMIKEIGG